MDERVRHLFTLGRQHYVDNDFERAEQCLLELLEHHRGFADVHNMLGVIRHHQGRLPEAQGAFEEALRINPGYTDAALNLAVTYNDLGQYGLAREVYGKAIARSNEQPGRLDPFAKGKLANMHAELGAAYSDLGMHDEAIREYRQALDLCPTFVDIRTRLGNALRERGKLEPALNEFLTVREQNPNFVAARLQLGLTYYLMGKLTDAESEWNAVLAVDPQNKMGRFYLDLLREQRRTDGAAPAAR
jgi:tetratricopeptide (TPR) repeat protein